MSNLTLGENKQDTFSSDITNNLLIKYDGIEESKRILKIGLPIIGLTTLFIFVSIIVTDQSQYMIVASISFVLLFVEYMLATRGHVIVASYIVSLTPSVMIAYSYVYYLDFTDEISVLYAFWLSIFFSALFLPGIHYVISLVLTLLTIAFTLQFIEGFTVAQYIEHFDLLFTFSLAVMFATSLFFGRHLMSKLLIQEVEKKNRANKILLAKTQAMEKVRAEAELGR